jgi:hypothetical protein
MSRFRATIFALVALTAGAALSAGGAQAQTAAPAADAPAVNAPAATIATPLPAKAKPRKKIAPTIVVVVTNSRTVALTELDAAAAGGAQAKQIVANLAPGKKTSVKVVHGKSCVFDLHGAYEDGSSTNLTSVDLCQDKNVNLVD